MLRTSAAPHSIALAEELVLNICPAEPTAAKPVPPCAIATVSPDTNSDKPSASPAESNVAFTGTLSAIN